MASQFTTSAYSINYKRLEAEADIYQHRILTRVPSKKTMVQGSLSFLNQDDKIGSKYTKTEKLNRLFKEANNEINDDSFVKFAGVCKNIFDEANDDEEKVAVYMLLEKVQEKLLIHYSAVKKLEKCKKEYEKTLKKDTETNASLDYFLNICNALKTQ
jgi:hypothetical protein